MMKGQGMKVDEQVGMSRNMLMSAMTGDEISRIYVSDAPIKVRQSIALLSPVTVSIPGRRCNHTIFVLVGKGKRMCLCLA
ncbi:MAG: hypothetical protein ACI9V8_000049 [Urechidicola sp.]|jgi:hypothetical protein